MHEGIVQLQCKSFIKNDYFMLKRRCNMFKLIAIKSAEAVVNDGLVRFGTDLF